MEYLDFLKIILIIEQGSIEQDVEQLKMYGKILNLTNRSNNE